MGDQRDLRLDAEAAHMVGASDRRVGDLFRARIVTHMRVGEEIDACRGDDERKRRQILDAGRKANDVADVVEARAEAPLEAADQRVGFAAMYGERRDHARRRTDDDARDVRRHALSLRHFEIGRDIVAIARIVARIDDFEIGVWTESSGRSA